VGFWRPRLHGCPTKHYCAQAGKALPAIVLGLMARVGSRGAQRLALPGLFVRTDEDEGGEAGMAGRRLTKPQAVLAPDEALGTARGCPLAQPQAAGLPR